MAISRSSVGSQIMKPPAKKPKLGTGKRFEKAVKSFSAKGVKDPKALAAYIGRKKYGAKKMAQLAVAGKKKSK